MKRTDSKQARKAEINMADLDHLVEENELLKQTSDKLDSNCLLYTSDAADER